MSGIFDIFAQLEKEREPVSPVTHIIVGLGNPGQKYTYTRHNSGFLALSYLSQKEKLEITKSKFKALVTDASFGGKRCLFMLPQTFMNNSGEAVGEAASFYKIPPENIVVIFDDINLPVGKMRVRRNGSAGSHNGIKSIIEHLGTSDFPRIKIGVGERPVKEMELADWVLSTFTDDEKKQLFEIFGNVHEAARLMIEGNTTEAMNKFN